jgi:hypothetical protein
MSSRSRSETYELIVRTVWFVLGFIFFLTAAYQLYIGTEPVWLGVLIIVFGLVAVAMALFAKLEWLEGLG